MRVYYADGRYVVEDSQRTYFADGAYFDGRWINPLRDPGEIARPLRVPLTGTPPLVAATARPHQVATTDTPARV